MPITDIRAYRPADDSVDTDLLDIDPLRDAFQRFASGVVLKFRDPEGTKFNDYPYGTRVEIEYNEDVSEQAIEGVTTLGLSESELGLNSTETLGLVSNPGWIRRGSYTVLEPERTTRGGMPMLEVTAVGYAHYLTREQVITSYTAQAKSAIIQDLIETFTPVAWVPDNVDLVDDSAIDLTLRGITPAEAISEIVSQSGDEDWGVNSNLEFFLRPEDTETAPAIDDADIIDHDLPEKGARSINKFTVYYGENEDQAWVEEDREAQEQLQEQLDAPRRVVVADSDSFPEISTEAEAKAKARKRLGEQSVIQTGTVTTPLGFWDTEAGDVFELTLGEAGIDGEEYRIAQHDYRYSEGVSARTIAENTDADIDEILVSLSESLTNERLQNVDPNATVTNALRIDGRLTVTIDAEVTERTERDGAFTLGQSQLGLGTDDELGGGVASTNSVSVESERATRGLLNLLRDLWRTGNSAYTDLSHLSVGSDGTPASRADAELGAERGRVAVERFGAAASVNRAEVTATLPAGGVLADRDDLVEVGVQDAVTDGNLYARLTTDAAIGTDATTRATIRVTATLDNNPAGQGVITLGGQEAWRDLLVGVSNEEPSTFVYGDGETAADETDTALENETYSDPLDSTDTGGTGTVRLVDRVDANDATTENFSELGQENAAGTLLSRYVFEEYGESVTIETNHSITVENP